MLDFSALNNDGPKRPQTHGNGQGNIKVPAGLKTEPAALTAAKAGAARETANEKNLLDLGKLLNERLGRAEIAVSEYNKALRAGQPTEEIALLAARALSLALSEELIYTSIASKYLSEYGIRISPEPPYKIVREK